MTKAQQFWPVPVYAGLLEWAVAARNALPTTGPQFTPEELRLVAARAARSGMTRTFGPSGQEAVLRIAAHWFGDRAEGYGSKEELIGGLGQLAAAGGAAATHVLRLYLDARVDWEERPGRKPLAALESYGDMLSGFANTILGWLEFDFLATLEARMEAAAPSAWVCTACGSPVLGDESVWTVTVRHEMVTPLPGLRPPRPPQGDRLLRALRPAARLRAADRPAEGRG